ncbi:GNAT family N-acetyltransferase [Leucobacter komagatae]|uniref:Acetyltransferase n=1 Tax=Leucobacter komagatae TaxID=55969 RepID=A0A0D0H633_9MICO|nr:GNAT family N-acetyltransferase [Leucobacter komagatae]KIP52585.1 acetyltransferase [Leucobacter komagatae]
MLGIRRISVGVTMRPLSVADAGALADAYVRNRTHLAQWEPIRPEAYYGEAWQAADLARRTAEADSGLGVSLGLFDGDTIIGRFNVAGVSRGPFQSAGLGYWVDHEHAGRGLASEAVQAIVGSARAELRLHRLEASTLLHNAGSQRVLEKAGFERIGMAPKYLRIAGEWQDHALFQVILHD